MGSQRGKLITCDRCGESIFLKELEVNEKETDGGFTRWNEYKYENIPEGWKNVNFGLLFNPGYMLCQHCHELFDKYRMMFFGIEERDDDQA